MSIVVVVVVAMHDICNKNIDSQKTQRKQADYVLIRRRAQQTYMIFANGSWAVFLWIATALLAETHTRTLKHLRWRTTDQRGLYFLFVMLQKKSAQQWSDHKMETAECYEKYNTKRCDSQNVGKFETKRNKATAKTLWHSQHFQTRRWASSEHSNAKQCIAHNNKKQCTEHHSTVKTTMEDKATARTIK